MSEIYTRIRLPAKHAGIDPAGYMALGRVSRSEAIRQFREFYQHQKEQAEKALAATDDELEVRVVSGLYVQHLVEKL